MKRKTTIHYYMPVTDVMKYWGTAKEAARHTGIAITRIQPSTPLVIRGIPYMDENSSLRMEKLTGGRLTCKMFYVSRKGAATVMVNKRVYDDSLPTMDDPDWKDVFKARAGRTETQVARAVRESPNAALAEAKANRIKELS